jgi:hypothetical protein
MGVIIAACLTFATLCAPPMVALQDAVNGVIPGPPTFYQWVLPLEYDGAAFTVPKAYASCGRSWDAQPYIAVQDGPLTISGPIVLRPACGSSANPNNVPSSADTPALYIVALPVSWTVVSRGGRHFEAKSSFPAIAVAGPVDPGDDPWTFAPLHPGLAMRANYGYMFFIAQLVAL